MSVIPSRRGNSGALPHSASNARAKRTRRQLVLEKLEERVVLNYSFNWDPTTLTATALSDGANNDTVAFEDVGGDLYWSVNGSPFSGVWTNTVTLLPTTVPDIATTTAVVSQAAGGTGETVEIGQPGTGHQASAVLSQFNIEGAVTSSSLIIDDSAGTVQAVGANAYQFNGTQYTGPNGTKVNVNNFQTGGITLDGSDQANTLNVLGTSANEPFNYNAGASFGNIVNVGNGGSLAGLNAALTVIDTPGLTTLNVNDQNDATSSSAIIDANSGNVNAPYEITGLSPAPIVYAGTALGGVNTININGGPGAGPGINYAVNATGLNSTTTINDGAGPDTVTVGDPLDPSGLNVVNGAVVVNGGGNTAITVDDSGFSGGGDTYTVTGTTVDASPVNFGGLTYSGATALTLNTETGSGADVEVNGTADNIPTTINDNSTASTVNVNSTGNSTVANPLTINTVPSGTGSTVSVVADNQPVNVNLNSLLGLASTAVDTVNIGSTGGAGTLDGVQAPVTITDPPSFYNLNVNDQNGGSRTFDLNTGGIVATGTVSTYPPNTPFVNFSAPDLNSLTVNGGPNGNTFNVNATPAGGPTTLNTGTGGDTVNVFATSTNTLNIHGQSGADTVTLGGVPGVGAQNLAGTINVDNASFFTALTVDDSQDTTGQTANLTDNGTTGTLTGLSPATINYTDSDLSSLTLNGGSGGNTFTINGTFPGGTTTLNSGTGADTTNVLATTGPLAIHGQAGNDTVNITNGGSTAGINGAISVDNTLGFTALTVDASADATSHDVSLSGNSPATLSGLSPAAITYTTGDLSSLTLDAGPSGNQTLNLDFSSGNPIPLAGFLAWNAGANATSAQNSHVLNITGELPTGPFTNEVQNAEQSGGPEHNGNITFTDSASNVSALFYTGLQPINDTAVATNYTLNNFANDDSFNAINGPVVGGVQTITFESAATPPTPPAFETTNVGNKTNITYNSTAPFAGVAGTVNITTPSAGLATLTIDTLNDAPNNVSFVNEPAGVVTSYFGGTLNDTTNVAGKGIPTGTTLHANGGAGIDTLNYDANGEIPTVTAGALPGEVIITIPGFGSVDAVNYEQINITNVGPLTVTPTATNFNTVEGFNYVNAPVGTFTTAVPVIFPTTPAGPAASDFTSTVDWGDPSPDKSGGTITQDATNSNNYFVAGSHTYTTDGSYTTTLSVAFSGGSVTEAVNGTPVSVTFPAVAPVSSSATATVIQGTLAVTAFPIVGTEGQAIASAPIATFIDAGGAFPASSFAATVSIVNSAGTTVVSGVTATITQIGNAAEYTVTAPTLTLPDEGTYKVLVTVTDNSGATPISVTGASQAVIADAALTAGVPAAVTASTGVQLTNVAVGTFTDGNTTASATDFTAVIDWGDGSPTSLATITGSGGTYTVEGSHQYAKPGTFTIKMNVLDDGGSTVSLTNTATVTDQAVTGSVNNFKAVEGQSTGQIVLATFTDPNTLATVANVTATLPVGGWGDGTPTTVVTLPVVLVGGTASGTLFEVLGSHTYAEEGSFPVNITVTTSGGVSTVLTAGTATVADAPLSSTGAQVTGVEGTATTPQIVATFTDSNPGGTVSDFTTGTGSVVVNWGDGSAPVTLPASDITASGSPNGVVFTVTASHDYAEEGTFATTITVTDTGGSTTIAHGTAHMADAALANPGQTALTGTEGQPLGTAPVQVATFTDANPTAPIADFTASIEWGDGTANSIGSITQPGGVGTAFFVNGNHTYAAAGTYTITVVVHDVGGSSITLTNTATISPVASTISPLPGQVAYLSNGSDTGLSTGGANTIGGPVYTSVTNPTFSGTLSPAVPNETVTLTATDVANGTTTVLGRATTNASGDWTVTSVALPQGTYKVTAVATDSTGHTTSPVTTLASDLVIDTTGPKVANVVFDRAIGTIYVTYEDPTLPDGTLGSGVSTASIIDAANYAFTRPHTLPTQWLVTGITPVATGVPGQQEVAVQINNGKLIKGGFNFNFTIFSESPVKPSGVQDMAENAMDGEFYGTFPSGNGINGGNFNARLVAFHNQVLPPITTVGTANPNGSSGSNAHKPVKKVAPHSTHHDVALSHVNVKHVLRHK